MSIAKPPERKKVSDVSAVRSVPMLLFGYLIYTHFQYSIVKVSN